MTIQESAQNYLETILMLTEEKGSVRSIDIATELDFSKPSVSVAMKKLRESKHITIDDDGFIKLTDSGLAIATEMYERHKFFTEFLAKIGVSHETAVKDACKIEHVLSTETFEKLQTFWEKSADKI